MPLTRQEDDRLYVHSEASHPARWHYVRDTPDAARSIAATDAHVTFCGHIHRPALYSMSSAAKMTSFIPIADMPVQLLGGRRWLAVLGSVGQPRDDNPDACYALLDEERDVLTFGRVRYDIRTAAHKIRAAGLPGSLAQRLKVGR